MWRPSQHVDSNFFWDCLFFLELLSVSTPKYWDWCWNIDSRQVSMCYSYMGYFQSNTIPSPDYVWLERCSSKKVTYYHAVKHNPNDYWNYSTQASLPPILSLLTYRYLVFEALNCFKNVDAKHPLRIDLDLSQLSRPLCLVLSFKIKSRHF